uniref:Uncharacterized protein n=1 Tax=Rhabditophanes sp. KR3021 TaxID=114890 RepID=A0AC35U0A0_9BILA
MQKVIVNLRDPTANQANSDSSVFKSEWNHLKHIEIGSESFAVFQSGQKAYFSECLYTIAKYARQIISVEKISFKKDLVNNESFSNGMIKEALRNKFVIKQVEIEIDADEVEKGEPTCESPSQRLYSKIVRLISMNCQSLLKMTLRFNNNKNIILDRSIDCSQAKLYYGYLSTLGIFSKYINPVFKAFNLGKSPSFQQLDVALNIPKKESLHVQRIFNALVDGKIRNELKLVTIRIYKDESFTYYKDFLNDLFLTLDNLKCLSHINIHAPLYHDNPAHILGFVKGRRTGCQKLLEISTGIFEV